MNNQKSKQILTKKLKQFKKDFMKKENKKINVPETISSVSFNKSL